LILLAGVGGFLAGVGVVFALSYVVRLLENKKRLINYFEGVVWPEVDDPRWKMKDGWLWLGDIKCCTMTNKNEPCLSGSHTPPTR
jgi:hypothetical protein